MTYKIHWLGVERDVDVDAQLVTVATNAEAIAAATRIMIACTSDPDLNPTVADARGFWVEPWST